LRERKGQKDLVHFFNQKLQFSATEDTRRHNAQQPQQQRRADIIKRFTSIAEDESK
jgi:hypothetical protein